jgi:hypothetical protein
MMAGVRAALGWLVLAALGQVAALQLMRAGPRIGFQRFLPPGELFGPEGLPWLLLIGAQAIAVVVGGAATWGAVWSWLRRNVPGWKLGALGAVFVATAAVAELDPRAYGVHLLFGAITQLLAVATVVLAARALDDDTAAGLAGGVDRFLGRADAGGTGARHFARYAAAYVFCVTALLGWLVYQWHPHVPDELVYLIHARYFADGLLAMPLPPVPEAFELDLMTYEQSRWYSPVPPGWPAVLAIGAALGVPWLVNPLLAGICVLLTHDLVRGLYDERTSRITTLLLCASPWFLFMAMNLMTHTFTLAAALAGAVAVSRLVSRGLLRWALPAGASIGVLGLIRPLEGLTVALLFALWVLFHGAHRRVAGVALMALAAIAVGAITLPYNAYLTGEATRFPIMAYTDALYGQGTNALGFGANRGLGWTGLDPIPGHGPVDVVMNTMLNAYLVNVELLGWATGSLLPLALLPLLRRPRRADRIMLIAILAITAAHAFYWFSGGPDFGARYWYLIIVPCCVVVARGILVLAERLEPAHPERTAAPGGARVRVLLAAGALCLAALVTFMPWRATDKYFHYRGMRPDVRSLAKEHGFGTDLVLVRGRRFPDYASAAAYNPTDMRSDGTIYAWDRSPEVRAALLDAYPDRRVWIVAGPSVTGGGYEIERGPVRAAELR